MIELSGERARAGAIAGLLGGAAFAVTMRIDMAISRQPVNDFRLLADTGPLRRFWRITGPVTHAVNSVAIGVSYSLLEPKLPGNGWQRGLSFALVENMLLWPIVILLDRVHPAIREGQLPRFNRPWPFIAENIRHAVYGVVLGLAFERLRRRN
jgi:hypothetical protein